MNDNEPQVLQLTPEAALARTTHLCVIAHQDDIEINAYPASIKQQAKN